METRANYVLIGAFTLAGFLGLLVFVSWFANIQLDRQFAYYDIDFETVSGLSGASDVRFAGLAVGQVVDVSLSPERNGLVRVRIEVDADTPVRTDSLATIESQGVTGVSYVGLSAGTPDAPLLLAASPDGVPMMEAGQSALQSLTEDAPAILEETLLVVRDLRQLIGGENAQRIEDILDNVEESSAAFAQALDDFSSVTGSVAGFAQQIERFNSTLDTLTADASGALAAVETTLQSVDLLAVEARGSLSEGMETLAQARTAIAAAERYIDDDLGKATARLEEAIAGIEGDFAALSEDAAVLMATYSDVGTRAAARLSEAEETLEAANGLIASVGQAAERFDGLMTSGAAPLIEELRAATAEATEAIALVNETAGTDLPGILDDLRTATAAASEVIETVGADLSSASGRLDALSVTATETLEDVGTTFDNANETLTAMNTALETGERALAAAERAFAGADRVVTEDVAEITAGLRTSLAELEATIGLVAEEIPAVTEDLRAASRSAESAFTQIESAVARSAPAVGEFSATTLPQFGRLAVETRALIENLDAIVEQLGRDPGRFLLEPRAPEYGR